MEVTCNIVPVCTDGKCTLLDASKHRQPLSLSHELDGSRNHRMNQGYNIHEQKRTST